MSTSTPIAPNPLLARSSDPLGFVRRLTPRIKELAGAAEAASEVPVEITDALYDEGIYSRASHLQLGVRTARRPLAARGLDGCRDSGA